ncbi:prepilin-type processing-associated H-X9-DG domain-containing protein [Abditibacterium utsteinense]|uniref:Prepilin-type processing-associated H-X9-DG domain-containing protein n=1 Tax=Abditibacterium utsteinense TaxID=1960156 RepID=A0A2S8SUF6_9BACT|nr:DUF1559 domain-containing protein [Abditibacterium utsteinense]PQV64432.1 prepilin-type processing-associated H-X9-DG domain-containing protein [Abditibacterium utsteinense]
MPQIDTLLSQMQRDGAKVAVLRGDAPLQFSDSETPGASQGATLSNAHVEEILSEILPPEARSALVGGSDTEFDYASPLGICRVQVRRKEGITAVKVTPNFVVAPEISAQNLVSSQVAPLNITPPAAPIQSNDSGQKNAVLPPELRGFNWGALLLSWVWAIGNKSWIGLLGIVPVIGFFVRFFLGFKGNQMAWKNRQWQSVEQFRATQKTWTIAGLCLVPISGFFLLIFAAILFPVFARARENARRAACQGNMKQISLGAMQYAFDHKGKFPSGTTMASWKKALNPYLKSDALYLCPGAKSGAESYLLNPRMAGINANKLQNAAQTPTFYDAESRHLDGVNVAFADGHIKWYRMEAFESQIMPQLVK